MVSQVLSLNVDNKLTDAETQDDECEWVRLAGNGDRHAFERLYRSHRHHVYGLCVKMCRDRFEAEECAQEAFVQAWRKLRLFRGDSGFGTWLHRVTVNTVLGRMRKARREHERLAFLAEPTDEQSEPDSSAGTNDIEAALKTLPSGARSVVVLCGIYGYSHNEASAMLGIAVGTCKAQLHRARKLLAAQLAA